MTTKDLFSKCDEATSGYFSQYRHQNDQYFFMPKLEGKPGPRMTYEGQEVIVWSINSYLGLHLHAKFQQAALKALTEFGPECPMGSRLMSGNSQIHDQLEIELAQFCNKESANLFANGYLGVMGVITALVDSNDYVIADRQCHACLIDGMRLATTPGNFRVFKHNDMDDLEYVLKSVRSKHSGGILILSEGLYGMTGEIAKLKDICELKKKYHARLMVDDAHGFGSIGHHGKGAPEVYQVEQDIDVYFSTFAKTFAGIGGFVAASESVIQYIKFNARSNIFTKSLPMIYASTTLAALEILKEEGIEKIKKLHHNAALLQNGLRELGYDLGKSDAQITPVYIRPDESKLLKIVKLLREQYRIFASPVAYPVIPKNTFLLRLVPTSLHEENDIHLTLAAFAELRDHL